VDVTTSRDSLDLCERTTVREGVEVACSLVEHLGQRLDVTGLRLATEQVSASTYPLGGEYRPNVVERLPCVLSERL